MAKKEDVTEGEVIEEHNDYYQIERRGDGRVVLGIILLIIGLFIIIDNYFPTLDLSRNIFPAILIVVGLVLVVRSFKL